MIKLNKKTVLDSLTVTELVEFHIENFFTMPETMKNLAFHPNSCEVMYTKNALNLLISNLTNTFGQGIVNEALQTNLTLKNKCTRLYKGA
jgi:hypothetical protein